MIRGTFEPGGRSDVKRGIRVQKRDRRWHWQTKCYNPAAPKLFFLKDLKDGITAGKKQALVTGEKVILICRGTQQERLNRQRRKRQSFKKDTNKMGV